MCLASDYNKVKKEYGALQDEQERIQYIEQQEIRIQNINEVIAIPISIRKYLIKPLFPQHTKRCVNWEKTQNEERDANSHKLKEERLQA